MICRVAAHELLLNIGDVPAVRLASVLKGGVDLTTTRISPTTRTIATGSTITPSTTLERDAARHAEKAFSRLNPEFGVPADRTERLGNQDVAQREVALALGVRVAVHDRRQNARNPVIWQAGQD